MNNLKSFFTAKINIGENISQFNTYQLKIVRRLSMFVLLLLMTGAYLFFSSTHAIATFWGINHIVAYLVAIVLVISVTKNGKRYSLIPFLPDIIRKVSVTVLAFYGQVVALVLMPGAGYPADHWVAGAWLVFLITLRYNIVKLYNSVVDKSTLL